MGTYNNYNITVSGSAGLTSSQITYMAGGVVQGSGMSGFHGLKEMALGSIFGVREWDTDKFGRLVGITHPIVLKPGVNTARCAYNKSKHEMVNCSCGFYAYLSERRPSTSHKITGVFESVGETLIGDRGFRAAKGRLVGYVVNGLPAQSSVEPVRGWLRRAVSWILPTRSMKPNSVADLGWSFALIGGVNFVYTVTSLAWVLSALAFALGLWGLLVAWSARRPEWRRPGARLMKAMELADSRPKGPVWVRDRLAGLYPDIPRYETVEELYAAHPLSSVEDFLPEPEPEPVLPDPTTDPDFWTRDPE